MNQILTPLQFTPFRSQAVSSCRSANKSPIKQFKTVCNSSRDHEKDDRFRHITIRSRLTEVIELPKNTFEKNVPSKVSSDSFREFQGLYHWLKESITLLDFAIVTTKTGEVKMVTTQKLDVFFCNHGGAESLECFTRVQANIRGTSELTL